MTAGGTGVGVNTGNQDRARHGILDRTHAQTPRDDGVQAVHRHADKRFRRVRTDRTLPWPSGTQTGAGPTLPGDQPPFNGGTRVSDSLGGTYGRASLSASLDVYGF